MPSWTPSPAAYVRRPPVPNESPTLGLSHLQFEAIIVAARTSTNPFDFALVAMLGPLGLRVFKACSASVDDIGEDHGHRVLRVLGKGTKLALIPLPPAVGRAIDRAVGDRMQGPVLLNRNGAPHGPTRRHPAAAAPREGGRRTDPADAPAHAATHLRNHHARRRCEHSRRSDRRPPCRPQNNYALRPCPQES